MQTLKTKIHEIEHGRPTHERNEIAVIMIMKLDHNTGFFPPRTSGSNRMLTHTQIHRKLLEKIHTATVAKLCQTFQNLFYNEQHISGRVQFSFSFAK